MNLKSGAHIHLMGICGTAMASLAGLLKDRGFKITGSDSNPYPPMSTQLEEIGIEIMKGYRAENLKNKPDFVIVGNVISAGNEEAQELVRLKIPFTSLAKAMGDFIIENRQCICVSGTHGKTTTTAIMAWIAENVGLHPGFLIGGIPKNLSRSFHNPEGDYFIIEGDEYDTAYFDKVPKFIHYKPRHVILTSVEFDHADIYKDLSAVMDAFSMLMKLIPEDGHLLAWAGDKNISELLKLTKAPVLTYGINQGSYQAKNVKYSELGSQFEVFLLDQKIGDFKCGLTGDYNVLNITAAIGMSHQLGWDISKVKMALDSFEGVKRRQEILGEPNGILVIEDFAHHPTAVQATIKGIRQKYPKRKVFAVFEPRSATSRRKIFQKAYVEAFQEAGEVLLAKPFDQSKIDQADRFSTAELIEDLKSSGKVAGEFNNADAIVEDLKNKAHAGDLILIMSNGGFDGIYGKLLNTLKRL
jgi:UDP-N-acetylmuramate: L-alanyl-gamma-D-glutamyl-meso-diaminopimelate ligase